LPGRIIPSSFISLIACQNALQKGFDAPGFARLQKFRMARTMMACPFNLKLIRRLQDPTTPLSNETIFFYEAGQIIPRWNGFSVPRWRGIEITPSGYEIGEGF
jgi:hypothetical protein